MNSGIGQRQVGERQLQKNKRHSLQRETA